MGFRFRRSVKIAPGVRMNFSHKGVGISAGTKGARVSVNSSGRRTTSIGIPGTGISYVRSKGGGSSKSSGIFGKILYWLLIGWWWWIFRFICYDFPKFLVKQTIKLVKYIIKTTKPEA